MDSKAMNRMLEFFRSRRQSYISTFNIEDRENQAVLADLSKFCRANETTFDKDPRAHAVLEGRREVFLRIQNYIKLTPEQLWDLYGRK